MYLEIAVATGNAHKMKEIREIFKGQPIVFYSTKDLNTSLDVEENGTTYKENALIKARALANIVKFPVIADDSGIEIKAFDNKPGIRTARYASEHGGNEKCNLEICNALKDNPVKDASFHCAIALIYEGKEYIFEGICEGKILNEPTGNGGFGYDPIFFSNELNKPLAEATPEEKNKVSHRGKASKKLITFLKINDYFKQSMI